MSGFVWFGTLCNGNLASTGLAYATAVQQFTPMPLIEIYTQPVCSFCARALQLFDRKGVSYREISAPHGTPERLEARRRSGGRTTVPQIFIDGVAIGGCDDLLALDRAGKLDPLLNA